MVFAAVFAGCVVICVNCPRGQAELDRPPRFLDTIFGCMIDATAQNHRTRNRDRSSSEQDGYSAACSTNCTTHTTSHEAYGACCDPSADLFTLVAFALDLLVAGANQALLGSLGYKPIGGATSESVERSGDA